MDNDKIITFEIPKGYKLRQRIFDKFVFERMNDRPTDIKEAVEILDISMFMSENYCKEQLETLQRLLVFRDAWWKMADDWKPDYDSGVNKYGIICMNGVVQESNPTTNWERHLNKVLDFPTAEMRDAFFENFKDLIEQCKELL